MINEFGDNLINNISIYKNDDYVRFHMPSHKGRNAESPDLYSADITELFFSDNLNYPNDIIKNHEINASKIFSSKETIFTVNGASSAIIASVMASIKPEDKILIPSNSHLSCYYGAVHAGANVVKHYISDYISGITFDEVKSCVENNPDIKACIITNPTFFGCCNDIKSVCSYLRAKNIMSIIDESHGTHFNFSDEYPQGALSTEADIVINSGHKTVNGLTQSAIINIMSGNVSSSEIRFYHRMLQSSSPSYILLSSLISAIEELPYISSKLSEIKMCYNDAADIINSTENFRVLNNSQNKITNAFDFDPFKLCVECFCEVSKAEKLLIEKYKIIPEMVYDNIIIFMAGLNTLKSDYERLTCALSEISSVLETEKSRKKEKINIPETKAAMNIRDASFAESEYVNIKNCANRISAGFISVYPPGAPVIIPGDIITEEAVRYIIKMSNVKGLQGDTCRVVKQ